MTDIILHLQYETDHKQYHQLFATFSELKNTVISYFKIPRHERNNINFTFEYERITLYIQDDEDVKHLNQILELLIKIESKILHIIWVDSCIKKVDVSNNKIKFQNLISEKSKNKKHEICSNNLSFKTFDRNIPTTKSCNFESLQVHKQNFANIENIEHIKIEEGEVERNERSQILLDNLLSKLQYTNENFCFKSGEKSNESTRKTFGIFWSRGVYPVCIMIINRLLESENNNCHYLHAKGAVYLKQNKLVCAIMTLLEINKIDKNYNLHFTILVQCYYLNKCYDKALEYIELELGQNPGNYLCKFLKVKILITEQKINRALKLLELCEKMHGITEETCYEKANIFVKLGKFKDAYEHFCILVKRYFDIVEYHIMVMKCLIWNDENIASEVYLSKITDGCEVKIQIIQIIKNFANLKQQTISEKDSCIKNTNLINVSKNEKLKKNDLLKPNNKTLLEKIKKNEYNNEKYSEKCKIKENSELPLNEYEIENNNLTNNNINICHKQIIGVENVTDDCKFYNPDEFDLSENYHLSIICFEDEMFVDGLSNNKKLKFEFKSQNPGYNPTSKELEIMNYQEISEKIENLREILKYYCNNFRSDLKLQDLKNITGHFLHNGDLFYKFEDILSKSIYCIRLIDCYSLVLLDMIRNYLLLDITGKCKDITDFTKYFELSEFYRIFKNLFEQDYTLEEFLNNKCSNRVTENKCKLNTNICDDSNKILQVFITADFKLGVTIIENNNKSNYELCHFKNFCTEKIYKDLVEKINNKQILPQKVKQYMDLKLHEFNYIKLDSKRKLAFRKKIVYDRKINDNNCFLFSLKAIFDVFPIEFHYNTFKDKLFSDQIFIANSILKNYNMQLVEISTNIEMLNFAVKNVIGKSILIFYNKDLPVHAEGIIDGMFSKFCQNEIKFYQKSYLTIVELKIMPILI